MPLARDTDIRRNLSLADRVQLEGYPWFSPTNISNAAIANSQTLGSLSFPSLSRAVYIDTLQMSSNRQVDIQLTLGGNMNAVQTVQRVILNAGATVTIPIRQVVRPSIAGTAANATFGNVQIRNVLDATATGAYINAYLSGTAVYDDFDYSADKVMLVAGDSILNGTAGITDKAKSMEWQVRKYFRARGKRVRVINRAVSGSTSGDHARMISHGAYDFPQVDYFHYQLGTNDAGQALSAASYKSNVADAIQFKKDVYPNAQMVVCGSTPLQNNTKETALIAMRTAAQQAVTEANDARVRFTSLAAAFDRTVESNYATSDASGDKTHPNDAGHAAAFGLLQTAFNGWDLAALV